MISDAEVLHAILMREGIGHTFKSKDLHARAIALGHNMSAGAVSGFSDRAQKMGMIEVIRKEGHSFVYKLIERKKYAFKPKSKGSPKGRRITRDNNQQVELALNQEPQKAEPTKETSLVERMLDIIAEVEALQSKTLADYSTDELLEEIKRRLA